MSSPSTAQEPILLGGLSFSGKTPLRIVLASHPNICMTRRTRMWTKYYGRYGNMNNRADFERCLNALLQNKHIALLGTDPERIRQEFWEGEPGYARLFGLIHMQYAERNGKPRWGDQLGSIERYADELFDAFPRARMIHMIRDPRSRYAASLQSSGNKRIKLGRETMRWLESVKLLQRNQHRYPGRYLGVRYEQLLAEPEQTVKEICAFINEDFVSGMVSSANMAALMQINDTADETEDESESEDEQQQVNDFSEHNTNVTRRAIAFIQRAAKSEMISLGYALEKQHFSAYEWLLYYLVDWPTGWAGMAVTPTFDSK
jgi:hypothetical protein